MVDVGLLRSLLPVELVLSLFAIVAAYLVISLPRSYKIKLLIIPLIVIGSFFIFTWFESSLGYPVRMSVKEDAIILNYRVGVISGEKVIELWTLSPKDMSRSRLVAIKWTQQREKNLRNAKKQKGVTVVRRKKSNLDDTNDNLEFVHISPEELAPKQERKDTGTWRY